jgi:hypothetical protein
MFQLPFERMGRVRWALAALAVTIAQPSYSEVEDTAPAGVEFERTGTPSAVTLSATTLMSFADFAGDERLHLIDERVAPLGEE